MPNDYVPSPTALDYKSLYTGTMRLAEPLDQIRNDRVVDSR